MFIILGFLILAVSFVIALVSLTREQRQIANAREKTTPKPPPVAQVPGQGVLRASDREEKIPKELKEEIYPWEKHGSKVGEGRGQKFEKVTISIRDLANSSKRELPDT